MIQHYGGNISTSLQDAESERMCADPTACAPSSNVAEVHAMTHD